MVFRCLRKSARRVENSIFPPYWSRLCGEDRHCTQKKPNLAGNRDGARLNFLLSSTFLWCCNFEISALERTLSGCLLSLSIDFTPFPVKLISDRTGTRTYTCRCISPNECQTGNVPSCSVVTKAASTGCTPNKGHSLNDKAPVEKEGQNGGFPKALN